MSRPEDLEVKMALARAYGILLAVMLAHPQAVREIARQVDDGNSNH
jgi:hypothetical protein